MEGTSYKLLIDTTNRIITFVGDVTDESMGELMHALSSFIVADDKKRASEKEPDITPITLNINSYGGDVYAVLGAIGLMTSSETEINTTCYGCAMSAGLLLFLAGNERTMGERATLMYYQISCWKRGKLKDLQIDMEENVRLQNILEEYVTLRTNCSEDILKENFESKTDWYIDAKKAEELGFATKIVYDKAWEA